MTVNAMSLLRHKRYFENLLGLILIAVLVLVFFDRLEKMSVIVERESIEQTLSVLRHGIQIYTLKKIIAGEGEDMRNYANTNPVNLLSQAPAHYVGEFASADAADVAAGRWYYDLAANQLVYRPARPAVLAGGDRRTELRYQLKADGSGNDPFQLRLLEITEVR